MNDVSISFRSEKSSHLLALRKADASLKQRRLKGGSRDQPADYQRAPRKRELVWG